MSFAFREPPGALPLHAPADTPMHTWHGARARRGSRTHVHTYAQNTHPGVYSQRGFWLLLTAKAGCPL